MGGGGARFLIQNGENGRKLQETLAPEKIYGEWEKFILKMTVDTRTNL